MAREIKNGTPSGEISITEHRIKLPTKWLFAIVAGAIALGGLVMKMQMDLSHDHELLHELRQEIKELRRQTHFMWGADPSAPAAEAAINPPAPPTEGDGR